MSWENARDYVSVEMRRRIRQFGYEGADIIDLTVGDPDVSPPDWLTDQLIAWMADKSAHRYPTDESLGCRTFREAVADFYYWRFGVHLDVEREVLLLKEAKEGALYLSLSLLEKGDVAIVCDPCYPTFRTNTTAVGANVYSLSLGSDGHSIPDLSSIPVHVWEKTKAVFINFPCNPTGLSAPLSFYQELVELAFRYGFIVVNDNVYSELYYGALPPCSLLEVPDAREVAVEIHSLSKMFSVCGWRIGMLVGNAEVLRRVLRIKQMADAGVFMPFQLAAAHALRNGEAYLGQLRSMYGNCRDLLVQCLRSCGFQVRPPEAGMFVWAEIPLAEDSEQFCEELLAGSGVACVPGSRYSQNGRKHVRFSLSASDHAIREACNRIVKFVHLHR
jgi:LL-diaminopimelate aminotransferase